MLRFTLTEASRADVLLKQRGMDRRWKQQDKLHFSHNPGACECRFSSGFALHWWQYIANEVESFQSVALAAGKVFTVKWWLLYYTQYKSVNQTITLHYHHPESSFSFIHKETLRYSDMSWRVSVDHSTRATIASDRAWQALVKKKRDKDFILQAALNPSGWYFMIWIAEKDERSHFVFSFTGIPFPIIVAWAIGKLYYDNEKWESFVVLRYSKDTGKVKLYRIKEMDVY